MEPPEADVVALRWFGTQWDRCVGWALIAGGATALLVAAAQARTEIRLIDQLSYLMSGGLGSLAAGLLGCGFLLSAGLHDEWRMLHGVESATREAAGRGAGDAVASLEGTAGSTLRMIAAAELERILGTGLVLAGAVILPIATRSAMRSLFPTEQVAYVVSGGIGALCLLTIGVALFLVAAVRDEARKVARIGSIAGTDAAASYRPAPRRTPLLALALSGVAGGAVVSVGWARAADATQLPRAMQGLVVGGIGLGLTALGAGGVVLWFRRRLGSLATEVFSPFEHRVGEITVMVATEPRARWSVTGLGRFHRTSCPALASATGERVPVDPATTTLEPCLLCEEAETA
jgi:hypothetical protein